MCTRGPERGGRQGWTLWLEFADGSRGVSPLRPDSAPGGRYGLRLPRWVGQARWLLGAAPGVRALIPQDPGVLAPTFF